MVCEKCIKNKNQKFCMFDEIGNFSKENNNCVLSIKFKDLCKAIGKYNITYTDTGCLYIFPTKTMGYVIGISYKDNTHLDYLYMTTPRRYLHVRQEELLRLIHDYEVDNYDISKSI